MTKISTVSLTNITQGPRGIGARAAGGAYTLDEQLDIRDSDSLQHSLTLLTGTTDALLTQNNTINLGQTAGNYMINTGSADAITIPAPVAGADDNLVVDIWSSTAYAHTVTAPSAIIAAGVALKTTITFPAYAGAGVRLRAYNGYWHIIGQGFTANSLS